jgi:hypothetical protein
LPAIVPIRVNYLQAMNPTAGCLFWFVSSSAVAGSQDATGTQVAPGRVEGARGKKGVTA